MVASFPKVKTTKKKAVMLQKGGSNIWIVPVPHDQISTHCVKRIDLQILLASVHAIPLHKNKKVGGKGSDSVVEIIRFQINK